MGKPNRDYVGAVCEQLKESDFIARYVGRREILFCGSYII